MAIASPAINLPRNVSGQDSPYRIMLVDDSAVIRGMVHRWLTSDPECQVVGSYHNGLQAVQHIKSCGAEIVILDVEMPEMDGLTALPQLIRAVPGIQIVMASTLTRRNADISMKALSMGAVDYLPKPESARSGDAANEFRDELIRKIKAIGGSMRRNRPPLPAVANKAIPLAPRENVPGTFRVTPDKAPKVAKALILRPSSKVRPEILAVGSSTGGPQALFAFFGGLKQIIKVPVLITQHMPPTFTSILAEHLQSLTGIPTKEASDGDPLRNGEILIAPGNYHMTVVRKGTDRVVRLDQTPQINFCRPAVDPMFESIANIYGPAALGVILTGMGHDGREGSRKLVGAGGTILAQDEKTSVVWGMPGAVAEAGLCSAVVPLLEMAPLVARHLQGVAR